MTIAIEARDVAFSFGKTPALQGASIAVESGEILAIMGPSGSGKSTLLHCIAGIVPPDSGTVHYDGRELSAMSDAERSALRRSAFGFVFQFGQLVPELSCRENVALPLRLDGVSRRVAEARADELLRSLEAFIEQNGQWERAARQVYCHRHTLRYRMRRRREGGRRGCRAR